METNVAISDPQANQFFIQQITTLLDNNTLTPGRAMVLGGDMVDEVELLLNRGYQVILIDPDGKDIAEAKKRGLSLKWSAKMNFMDVKPWHVGHLDLILDRDTLNSLGPDERFAYANRMGRFLPCNSYLLGLYRLGFGPETHTLAHITEDYFQRIMGRYFNSEHPKIMPSESQESTKMVFHKLQRRSSPRKPPRQR